MSTLEPSEPAPTAESLEGAFAQVLSSWRALDERRAVERSEATTRRLEQWSRSIGALSREQEDLRQRGLWLHGHRTLLQAVDRHQSELALTAGLRWLLQPEGHHRLGRRVVEHLLQHLGLSQPVRSPVTVVTEEQRADTRADLVLRMPGVTVLIEAKVWAHEQDRQLERLAELWQEETPVLVFLTPLPRDPETAGGREWRPLLWATVAELVRRAEADAERDGLRPAGGVEDYVTTLEMLTA